MNLPSLSFAASLLHNAIFSESARLSTLTGLVLVTVPALVAAFMETIGCSSSKSRILMVSTVSWVILHLLGGPLALAEFERVHFFRCIDVFFLFLLRSLTRILHSLKFQ